MRNEFPVMPKDKGQLALVLGFLTAMSIATGLVPYSNYVDPATVQILTFFTFMWVLYWIFLILAPKKWEN